MPANTRTHVDLTLRLLSYEARRILWAFRTKTPLQGIQDRELHELFERNILRTDYDFISKGDVVLLTPLGKRCVEWMAEPQPPAPPIPPRKGPTSTGKRSQKRKSA